MVMVRKKNLDPKDLIDGSSIKGETVEISYEALKHITKAAGLLVIDGEEHWIPKSMIEDADEERIWISQWFAEQGGIIDSDEDSYYRDDNF